MSPSSSTSMPMDQSADKPKFSGEEFRLRLQLETTLLVWVRTSLALMGFGFVIARFGLFLREIARVGDVHTRPRPWLSTMNTFTGTAIILLGVVVLLIAVYSHLTLVDRLQRGELDMPSRWSLGLFLSMILAALGMGMAVYLGAVELQ